MEAKGESVKAVKVAQLLLNRYVEGLNKLRSTRQRNPQVFTLDDTLAGLDQHYAGMWAKLDEARAAAERAGADTGEFDRVRAAVRSAHTGYKQRNKIEVGIGSVRQTTTLSVNTARVETAQAGLAALQALFPGTDWGLEEDADVARFLARRKHRTLRSLAWVVLVALLMAIGAWLLV